MNWKRGLFRLWLLFSALFVIATAVVFYPDVKSEFEKARLEAQAQAQQWPGELEVPVPCGDARGKGGEDYKVLPEWTGMKGCWYRVSKFRVLYPEYKDLSDKQLEDRLYEKAGMPRTHPSPWTLLLKTLGIAIGVPLMILVIGAALLWSFAGFAVEQKVAAKPEKSD
jgi:hypothetical protein